jgi:hypothetical protein
MATSERELRDIVKKQAYSLAVNAYNSSPEYLTDYAEEMATQMMQLITQAVTEARTEELSGALDVAFNADTQQEYIDYLEGRLQAQLKGEK